MGNKIDHDLADSYLVLEYKTYIAGDMFKYHIPTLSEAKRIANQIKKEYPKASFSLIRVWEEKVENWE